MNLPPAPGAYTVADQTRVRAELLKTDGENYKRGRDIVLAPGQRLILPEVGTGKLHQVRIVSGALVVTAL